MVRAELSQLAKRARAQVFEHILPFWCGPALDHAQGGWLPWMSNDLQIDRSQPKGLILNSRILWAFSAAYRVQSEPVYREMCQRALDFVLNRFWDPEFGGAYWRLDSSGAVREDSKKIYGQAFYIYALAEYYQAFKSYSPSAASNPDAKQLENVLRRAVDLFELIEVHAHDPANGGYLEVCQRDWAEAPNSRLSEKDMAEKKSMNNHLHVLEAYTNLYRVWKDPRVARRLSELIELFEVRILDAKSGHLHHFFDETWGVRSVTHTFGHDIEASWLLYEAAEALNDSALLEPVRAMASRMTKAVLIEGLDQDGGLFYEGKPGTIIDRRKECWPQAEAVVGFLNAFELSGQEEYLRAAVGVWDYIENHLVDREKGEWFWRINLDGRPDPSLPKVSEWKGPYHGTRACLEVMARTKRIQQSANV